MPRVLLTHTDLDGAGCAVVFAAAVPGHGGIHLVENGSIDARVGELLESGADDVVVADHGLRPETAAAVDRFVEAGHTFALLDHHRSTAHLAARPWATIDESHSATWLLFEHVGAPPALREFAAVVEDHDLWRHADPRSTRLASLAGLLGHDRFRARFAADPSPDLTAGEEVLLEVEERRRHEYLRKKLAQARTLEAGGVSWAWVYAEQYQSDLAELLMNELGVAATAIVNPARRTVSLRGRDVDVSPLAVEFGGGGHARAAAFTFAGRELEVELARFESALEAILRR